MKAANDESTLPHEQGWSAHSLEQFGLSLSCQDRSSCTPFNQQPALHQKASHMLIHGTFQAAL